MERKLTDICKIQYGYAFDSARFSDSQGVPLIRIRDVVRGYSETYTTEKASDEYIVNDGDMLIGMDGEFNIAHWKGGNAYLNQRVCRLIPTDDVDPLYLFYYMPKALKSIEDKTPFVTVKHLSAKELNKIIVPLPTREEQHRIAASLRKVDELIALRKEQLVKLDQLVKSRFIELFGEPECNPNNWEKTTIGKLIRSCEAGWSGNGTQRDKKPGEIAVLKVSAVTKGYFVPEECKVLDNQGEIKKYVFPQKGDLLFSRANTREMVGATAVILQDYPELILPDKLWKIRFISCANVLYMKHILSHPSIRAKFSEASTGTSGSMFNVSMEKFKSVVVPLPPIEFQNQFAAFVEQTDKSKLAIQQSLDKLETLKKSLMQEYFG